MTDCPFGRQPLPVTVTIEGDPIDVVYWLGTLTRAAEFKGDCTHRITKEGENALSFRIYPNAVND